MYKRAAQKRGFTLLELLIVMVVVMVVTVAAFPTIARSMQVMRLQNSAQNVASILQRTRILAVKGNTNYSVVFGANGQVCIDQNYSGTCNAGEPMVQLASTVSLVTDGTGPSTAQITCGGVGTGACPGGFTGLNYQPQGATVVDSYNARGLPCVGNPATTEPNPANTQCREFDAANNPVGFIYLLRSAASTGNAYAAVTVTPSGLVGVWQYSGTTWGQQ